MDFTNKANNFAETDQFNISSKLNISSAFTQAEEIRWPRTIITVVCVVLTLSIIMSNGLVISAVTMVRKLRQPANYLIVSLAFSDFLVGLVVLPLTITHDMMDGWVFGAMMCNVHVSLDVFCCTASIMNLCMISIDRYLLITRPMTYPAQRTGKLMTGMIAAAWMFSCFVIFPALFGFASNITTDGRCLICQEIWFTLYSTIGAFFIPITIMLTMYWKILKMAKKIKRQHVDKYVNYEMESRNASRDRMRNVKATRTLGIIAGTFIFCWVPFFILTFIRPFVCKNPESQDCFPIWLERTVLWLGYLNSIMNPIIYIGLLPELRKSFLLMLKCKRRNIDRTLAQLSLRKSIEMERNFNLELYA